MIQEANKKQKESLEEQYKKDYERRLDNTVRILEEVAEEAMEGNEKEDFLKNLKGENKNG